MEKLNPVIDRIDRLKKILDRNNVTMEKFKEYQQNAWIRFLHMQYNKIHKHEWNMLGATVGLPRTGKSVFTAYTCSMMNPRFSITRDIVYTSEQFKKRMDMIEHIGETIIWDEAGVGMSSRDWFKIQNKNIGKALQSIGHMRPIIFFVSPDISFIDSQARKLFHHFFEVYSRTENYSRIKPFKFVVDKKKGHVYYKYPKFLQDGLNKFKTLNFWKPPQEFIKEYSEHSNPQKVKLRAKSEKNQEKDNKMDLLGVQKRILENPLEFCEDKRKKKISWKLIMGHYQDILQATGNPKDQAIIMAAVCQQKWNEGGIDNGFDEGNNNNGSDS